MLSLRKPDGVGADIVIIPGRHDLIVRCEGFLIHQYVDRYQQSLPDADLEIMKTDIGDNLQIIEKYPMRLGRQ